MLDTSDTSHNTSSSSEPDEKPKLREWEKHKAPWLEEMKANQAKRTSTSPGPPSESRVKLTPTGEPKIEDKEDLIPPTEKEVNIGYLCFSHFRDRVYEAYLISLFKVSFQRVASFGGRGGRV